MKKSEITNEAKKILKTLFNNAIESNNKEDWKKAINAIDNHINKLKQKRHIEDIGMNLFIWDSVKFNILKMFGKKFIQR